jgi:hypothetical protein
MYVLIRVCANSFGGGRGAFLGRTPRFFMSASKVSRISSSGISELKKIVKFLSSMISKVTWITVVRVGVLFRIEAKSSPDEAESQIVSVDNGNDVIVVHDVPRVVALVFDAVELIF